ncbi:uncharacterized protein LOC106869832 [Octopus bimaculoides]|uniref:uncharacterized protein LOC106869832 n=1 Tax=Octopus bimaculoides TaxID=37653 RepID=UPI0022E714F0|nr:uncharacterized protein LOC106869832 [Octopus bimaculoides]
MLRFIPNLFVIIIIVSLDKVSSNGHTDLTLNHKYFPLGVIGCMVGEGLCGAKESCIDDNLFGICSEKGLPLQVPNYDLTDPQRIGLLESKILKLLIEGYTWQDAYTQCIVQNLLVASATTTLDAALPLDCSGGGHGASGSVGGADETISPLLLSQWSLLNDDKDLDVAEHRDAMAGRNDIISDSGVSASAIMGTDGGGGRGASISDSDDGDGDGDDDDREEEERQEQDVGGGDDDDGGNSIDGSLDYNSDVYDSVPMPPVQQQHPSFLKSSKRDEIVRIHKYFDQPAVPSRRSSEPPLSREEALAERYGLMPNSELIDSIPAAERDKVFERVFSDAGALDGDSIVADNGNDDDSVVDREALRLMNEISASADPKLEDQSNENIINADLDADANAALDLTPLTYVPPDSSRLNSNIIVAGDDQNNNNNYNTDDGDDDDDDRNDRSLKRSVAENLVDFDGTERNQLLPQYLLNLQKLLSQQIGSESESKRENERERGIRMKANNPDENLFRNNGLQDDEMTNKMILDYPLPDYSLLSDLANDYRGMNDKGRIQQDNGLGANSLKPGTKGLWGEDFKQMPETDYDYDYPTETAVSDPRFPVFKSSLKSDDSLPNLDRPIDSDKLDLSDADSEVLKTLLKDILMKAVDVPPSQSQSVGASLSDSGSNDGKFMSNDLGDIDLSQLKQAEELLRKTGQLKSKSLLNLDKGDRHPKFTLLQRVGEPVNKKAVLMTDDNDETATVSEEKPGQATDPQKHYDQVDANYAFVGISNG